MKLDCSKLKVVLFDWDGTLAKSSPPRIEAVNKILAEYHLPDWENVKNLRNDRLSFMDNFPNIFGAKAKEAYQKYCTCYLECIKHGFDGYPMAREVIDCLRARGVKIAIMTNKDRSLLEAELPLLYPCSCFDKIVCGHEACRDKPCGDHALYTLRGLIDKAGITPQTVWVIGDSQLDNLCANEVNALPIRINYPPKDCELKECCSTIYFDNYQSLFDALN